MSYRLRSRENEDIENIKAELESKLKEITNLTLRSNIKRKVFDILERLTKLEEDEEVIRKDNTQYEKKIFDLENENKGLRKKLNDEISRSYVLLNEGQEQVEVLKEKIKEFEISNTNKTKKIETLVHDMDLKNSETEKLLDDNNRQQKDIKLHQSEINKLKETIHNLEKKNEENEENIEKLKSENEDLTFTTNTLKNIVETLKKENTTTHNDIYSLVSAIESDDVNESALSFTIQPFKNNTISIQEELNNTEIQILRTDDNFPNKTTIHEKTNDNSRKYSPKIKSKVPDLSEKKDTPNSNNNKRSCTTAAPTSVETNNIPMPNTSGTIIQKLKNNINQIENENDPLNLNTKFNDIQNQVRKNTERILNLEQIIHKEGKTKNIIEMEPSSLNYKTQTTSISFEQNTTQRKVKTKCFLIGDSHLRYMHEEITKSTSFNKENELETNFKPGIGLLNIIQDLIPTELKKDDVLIISGGSNDLYQTSTESMKYCINRLGKLNAEVILLSIPPQAGIHENSDIIRLNTLIKYESLKHENIHIINTHTFIKNHHLARDGFHLGRNAKIWLSKKIENALVDLKNKLVVDVNGQLEQVDKQTKEKSENVFINTTKPNTSSTSSEKNTRNFSKSKVTFNNSNTIEKNSTGRGHTKTTRNTVNPLYNNNNNNETTSKKIPSNFNKTKNKTITTPNLDFEKNTHSFETPKNKEKYLKNNPQHKTSTLETQTKNPHDLTYQTTDINKIQMNPPQLKTSTIETQTNNSNDLTFHRNTNKNPAHHASFDIPTPMYPPYPEYSAQNFQWAPQIPINPIHNHAAIYPITINPFYPYLDPHQIFHRNIFPTHLPQRILMK